MKKFNLSLTGACVAIGFLLTPLAFSIPVQAAPAKSSTKTTKKMVYTCPMHVGVVSLKPGKCPKCKMAMVKKSVASLYTCSMHPEVLSLKAGKCPKCKMPLIKRK
jgi:hypothetical protein